MMAGQKERSGGERPGAGRPPQSATIKNGASLMLSHVYADGTADLGRGHASISRVGSARLITIPQADGSEIRILVL